MIYFHTSFFLLPDDQKLKMKIPYYRFKKYIMKNQKQMYRELNEENISKKLLNPFLTFVIYSKIKVADNKKHSIL